MPKNITINGTTFSVPIQSDDPPWGDDLTDALVALAAASNSTTGPGDILTTTVSITNNVSSPVVVAGLIFDQSSIRAAEISYSIDRSTTVSEVTENGKLYLNYNNTTNTWHQSQFSNGDAGLSFSVVSGQVYYTSTNLSGSNYQGKMSFSAKGFAQ